ncbi:kinase-like domain-containing protein [Mycena floridula]|nr:kinase-like domain-containing protein [Mycena floridula]
MRLTTEHQELLQSSFIPGPNEYTGTGERTCVDFIWVDLQLILKDQGYKLRPRFQPVWQPSWLPGGKLADNRWSECEDSLALCSYWGALDALRIKDKQKVVLKIVLDNTAELELSNYFSMPPIRDDPRNHCVQVLDIITFPGRRFKIMVLPFLTPCDTPRMHCMPEVIDFIRQMLEGLEFMHQHNIAHGDITPLNIMMEGSKVVPSGSHFSSPHKYALESGLLVRHKTKHRCRVGPVRYSFIDLGFSRRYSVEEQAQELKRVVQVRVTPNVSEVGGVPSNPFKSDIMRLGSVFKYMFSSEFCDLNDFNELFDKMTAKKPADRPTAAEAVLLLDEIVSLMPKTRLKGLVRPWYWRPSRFPRHCPLFLLSILLALLFILLPYRMLFSSLTH